MMLKDKYIKGGIKYREELPTVIVVSHEASKTGAPILALNICKNISEDNNIIIVLMRDGVLKREFIETSVMTVQGRLGNINRNVLNKRVSSLTKGKGPRFAIVNSVVAGAAIQPIRSLGIPVITLIHEFSSYIRPLDIMDNIGLWSNILVFSSQLTYDDLYNKRESIRNVNYKILPQGPCEKLREDIYNANKDDDAWKFLKDLEKEKILILGAGQIQQRKGIDIFVSVASEINRKVPNKEIQFAWIGEGYDPVNDFNVSLWIEDQINRSGLKEKMIILDNSTAYGELMKRADLFLITSRLDPLPNVGIDAIMLGKPVLCFKDACGIANLLAEEKELGGLLIASYLNTTMMGKQATYLIENKKAREKVQEMLIKKGKAWFDMKQYITEIMKIGANETVENTRLQLEMDYIQKNNVLDRSYIGSNRLRRNHKIWIMRYLLSWKREIGNRKPFPGFHPGIYRENTSGIQSGEDPLIHYLKAGSPSGKWITPLITPRTKIVNQINEAKVAIHIHVFYPDLLDEILLALSKNRIKPDVFISHNDQRNEGWLTNKVKDAGYQLRMIDVVPNRGRDIGPLLTLYGRILDKEYDIHGHFHTKKSIDIRESDGKKWRQYLLGNLIGREDMRMADRIISEIIIDKKLGIVFPDDPNCIGWCENKNIALTLSKRLNIIRLPDNFNFPIGTMFWAKRGALRNLYDLKIDWEEYPSEPISYDGTILHAIERIIPLVAIENGYKYKQSYCRNIVR